MLLKSLRWSAFRTVVAVVLVALVAAACGGDGGDEDAGGDDTAAEDTADDTSDDTDDTDDGGDDTADDGGDDAAGGEEEIGVALILKTATNPFFVSMEQSAQAAAEEYGVNLTVAAGQEDGDTQTQIQAIEQAIARGDAGILITPSGPAVSPALEQAREAGLYTIALDTAPTPPDAVDITFATDNTEAGRLIGAWTAGQLDGEPAVIAMLDIFNDQVVSVGVERDQGFLIGMGILEEVDYSGNGNEPPTGTYEPPSDAYSGGDYEVICHEPTQGSADGGREAMETCLALSSDINVVYTINEPAAQGAAEALRANNVDLADVIIVSVDGGCSPGLDLVEEGVIGATSQQYPGDMAELGVEAIAELVRTGEPPETTEGLDFFNTGVQLITDSPVEGVDSISVEEGRELCWG